MGAEEPREGEMADPEAQPGVGGAVPIDWGGIRLLDLRTAEQIALRNNPSFQAAAERVRQAEARIAEARSAYWPRLDAAASASRVDFADSYPSGSLGFPPPSMNFDLPDPEDYYRTGLAANWVVFNGLAREFSAAIARHGALESEALRREAGRLLLSAVATAYHGTQLAREEIAIAAADETFNLRQFNESEARRREGKGSLSDVLNFEVRVNGARSVRIGAEQLYEATLVSLAALLGLGDVAWPPHVEVAPLVPEVSEELQLPDPETEVAAARQHRPDILASRQALERSRAGIGFARSDYYPSLNLSASVEGERSNSGRFEEDDFGNTVALSLSYNLFDGGGRRARVRAAEVGLSEAERNLEEVEIAVAADVRKALAQLAAAREQLVLQRQNTVLVERNRELVEKEYAAGQASLVRLNEAQRDLTASRSRLALALVSLRQAWHNLETATGRILLNFFE